MTDSNNNNNKPPKIILIAGKKGSGKSTLSRAIVIETEGSVRIVSIASRLKKLVTRTWDLYGTELENLKRAEAKTVDNFPVKDLNLRRILQRVGTAFREEFGENFWVTGLADTMDYMLCCNAVIIDDIRYDHEVDFFRDRYGEDNVYLINIVNPDSEDTDEHSSEKGITRNPDYFFHNEIKYQPSDLYDIHVPAIIKELQDKWEL